MYRVYKLYKPLVFLACLIKVEFYYSNSIAISRVRTAVERWVGIKQLRSIIISSFISPGQAAINHDGRQAGFDPQELGQLFFPRNVFPNPFLRLRRENPNSGRLGQTNDHGQSSAAVALRVQQMHIGWTR